MIELVSIAIIKSAPTVANRTFVDVYNNHLEGLTVYYVLQGNIK